MTHMSALATPQPTWEPWLQQRQVWPIFACLRGCWSTVSPKHVMLKWARTSGYAFKVIRSQFLEILATELLQHLFTFPWLTPEKHNSIKWWCLPHIQSPVSVLTIPVRGRDSKLATRRRGRGRLLADIKICRRWSLFCGKLNQSKYMESWSPCLPPRIFGLESKLNSFSDLVNAAGSLKTSRLQ